MRSFVAAAVAAVALASSASAQTCSTANLAFVTSPSGPFVSECAQTVTANTLSPYGVVTTQLLDPAQSTAAFLLSTPVTTKLNALLNAYAQAQGKTNRTNAGWPAYPFSANPLVYNFSDPALGICAIPGSPSPTPAPCGQLINATISGGAAYILCPVLKQVVKDLVQCIPKNCSALVGGLCASPTAATAASLMGTYANTPFVTGTLTMFGAITQLCGGAQQAQAQGAGTLYNAVGIATGNFNYTCADIAPASAIGTFQYSSTNSPTQSAAAEVGMGAVAAVATLAAAAFAF